MYKVNSFITTDREVASYEKRLSICLWSNGFSFSIATTKDTLFTVGDVSLDLNAPLGELTASIKSFFADHNLATFGYGQMSLLLPTRRFVWVPAPLYEAGQEKRYLETVSPHKVMLNAYSVHNPLVDAYLVFEADSTLVSAFKIALPGIMPSLLPSSLVAPSLLDRSADHPVLAMNLWDGSALFAAFDHKKLLLTTCRSIADNRQILYNALDVMKRLGIEKPNLELLLSGNVDRTIYQSLGGYFPKIDLYCGRHLDFLNPQFQNFHIYRYAAFL